MWRFEAAVAVIKFERSILAGATLDRNDVKFFDGSRAISQEVLTQFFDLAKSLRDLRDYLKPIRVLLAMITPLCLRV